MGDVLLRTTEKPGIGFDFVRAAGIGVRCVFRGVDEGWGEPLAGDARDSQRRDIPGLARRCLPMTGPKPVLALMLCDRPFTVKWNELATEVELERRNGNVAVPRM